MSAPAWTRDDLVALVRGRFLMATDDSAQGIEPPVWLRAAALDLPVTPGSGIELTHPDYRAVLVNTWIETLSRPGELVECETMSHIVGDWARSHVHMVNLLDHPDVGGILIAALRLEMLEDVEAADTASGEWDTAAWAMVTLDRSVMIRRAEGLVEHIFGSPADELIGRNIVPFWHPDALAETVTNFSTLTNTEGATYSARRLLRRADGSDLWVEMHAIRRYDPEVGEDRITLILHDISQRRAQEEELRQSHEDLHHLAADFRLLAEEVPSPVFRCDADGVLTFHNSHWIELLRGHGEACPTRLHDIAAPDDRPDIEALLASVNGTAERITVEVRAADGRRTFALTCRAVEDTAGGGGRRILGSAQDVTATVELRRQARIDPLTGLLNRTGIEERLREALADHPRGVCIAFIDLDNFKEVNDRLGHEQGDRFLVEMAGRLLEATRPHDAVGRFGGDEFVIVFDDAGDASGVLRDRLDAALRAPLALAGETCHPTASIGLAVGTLGDDLHDVLRRADEAMFAVKRARQQLAGRSARR